MSDSIENKLRNLSKAVDTPVPTPFEAGESIDEAMMSKRPGGPNPNTAKGYIGKLNIVAAEYLAKAGMARVACVTCQVPALSGASSGVIFSRPLSVRVLPSGSACMPFPGGSVHSSNNPYIGATGRFISIINVPTTSSLVCEYATCRTNVGVDGNIQRSQSYAMGPYPWIGNHPSCEAIPNHQLIPLLRRS